MRSLLILVSLSVACQSQVDPVSEEVVAPEQASSEGEGVSEAALSEALQGIIQSSSVDVEITGLAVGDGASSTVEINGTATDNATIKVLLEAMEGHSDFSNVYLVSTEKGDVESADRQVFKMTTNYLSTGDAGLEVEPAPEAGVFTPLLTGIIQSSSVDVEITSVVQAVGDGASSTVEINGTAADNATIKVLLEAMEGHSDFSNVYLVSTEKEGVESAGRQVFKMTANYLG